MAAQPFYARHEFFLRRLALDHRSLSGRRIHADALDDQREPAQRPSTFQKNLYQIHSLESLLPIVEWLFILLPILFHGILGVVIIRSGQANTSMYPFAANIRYTLQRATGIIAFAFIVWHVFHMHGWFHFDALGRARFGTFVWSPLQALQRRIDVGHAMSNGLVLALYAVGVMSCVYHFANGLWTMGITWGLWTSVGAQRRALQLCGGFGVALAILAVGVLYGTATVDIRAAKDTEDRMYESLVNSKEIRPNPEKRSEATEGGAAGRHPRCGLGRSRDAVTRPAVATVVGRIGNPSSEG